MLTDDDLEYMESYSSLEMESPTPCNYSTLAREVVMDSKDKETLCNFYHIKVRQYSLSH